MRKNHKRKPRVLRHKPIDFASMLNNAFMMIGRSDYAGASKVCLAILDLDQKNGDAWRCLGVANQKQGRMEEAIVDYRKALDCNPDDYYAWSNLGSAYCGVKYQIGSGKRDEAGSGTGPILLNWAAPPTSERSSTGRGILISAHPIAGDPWDDRPTLGPNVSRFPSAIPAGQRGKRDKSEEESGTSPLLEMWASGKAA